MVKNFTIILLCILPWNRVLSQSHSGESETRYVKISPLVLRETVVASVSKQSPVKIQPLHKSAEITIQGKSQPGVVNIVPSEIPTDNQLANRTGKQSSEKDKPNTLQPVTNNTNQEKPDDTPGQNENKEVVTPQVNTNLVKLPYLVVEQGSIKFTDKNNNKIIDAGESTVISFNLKNTGSGPAKDVKVSVTEKNSLSGLQYEKSIIIGTLDKGSSKAININVGATTSLISGKAVFEIIVDEQNGFGTDPMIVEVSAKSYSTPMIKIVDYDITSSQGNTIQKRQPFEVNVLVQNVAEGLGENIQVNLIIPQNIFCLSANEVADIPLLGPGESQIVQYTLVTNNNYSSDDIPLQFNVTEKYSKYSKDSLIVLHLDQAVLHEKLVVKVDDQDDGIIEIGSLSSSIDKNIPLAETTYPNRIALIIGNQDYSGLLNSEINVDFARNDAEIFKKYASYTLGVEEKNLFFLLDATAGEMRRNIDLVAKLAEKMGKGTELIFYYAGHGIPDEVDRAPYLIPTDVDATNLQSAIKLSDLYKKFGSSGADKVIVILDACFTGGARNQGLLAARAVKVKPKQEMVSGNMIVFSASSGEQSALAYESEGHGIFTYFLLKKIKETGGDISYGELADYVTKNVSVESLRINKKEQDPEINVSFSVKDKWQNWRVK